MKVNIKQSIILHIWHSTSKNDICNWDVWWAEKFKRRRKIFLNLLLFFTLLTRLKTNRVKSVRAKTRVIGIIHYTVIDYYTNWVTRTMAPFTLIFWQGWICSTTWYLFKSHNTVKNWDKFNLPSVKCYIDIIL